MDINTYIHDIHDEDDVTSLKYTSKNLNFLFVVQYLYKYDNDNIQMIDKNK